MPDPVTSLPDSMAPEDLLAPTVPEWVVAQLALSDALADHDADRLVLALPVPGAGLATAGPVAEALDLLGLSAAEVAAAHEPAGRPGATTTIPLPPGERAARAVLLVGIGAATPDDLRSAGAAVGRSARGREVLVTQLPEDLPGPALAAYVEGTVLGGWSPPKWTGGGTARPRSLATSVLVGAGTGAEEVVRRAATRARAALLARGLAITPSNIKNPAWLADQAVAVAGAAGLAATVHHADALRAGGFGGLLAVGSGSVNPPALVQLEWVPEGAGDGTRHVVLVGKGITFDTGGLNVKPAEGMASMKTDMSGSAIVLAVLAACRDLAVPVRVTGLLALAENALGSASYRPGDVIAQFGGTTVEVGNTDAEGRLVLADALAYADRELSPDLLVDVATLTGAARVALARSMAPVYASDDGLRDALVAAGQATGELLWPFPLVEDYRPLLDSEVADLNHISGGPYGGSITAALFLRAFAGERPWAHLDIAGPGRSDVDAGILSKGGTGFGTRLLLTWLENLS